jgi:hypothetical protein
MYINGIWKNSESTVRHFTDNCIIHGKIVSNNDAENLQKDLNGSGGWAFENEITKLPNKGKAVCFMKAQVTESLNYSLQDTVISEANTCKYLGIIFCSDLSWVGQVNYKAKKAWKALHFTMPLLKKETVTLKA